MFRDDARADRDASKEALAAVVGKMVTQAEMKWRTDRALEDRKRTDDAVADIRTNLVPRQELDRVFDGYKQQFADLQDRWTR